MKKRFSISYFLIHVLLFIFVGLIVFSGFSIYQFSNHYPLHQKEYIDSSQFYQSYMKYIERLTFYIHYTDSGFRLDLSSPANLSEIIQPVDNNSITDMNQYFDQNELENYEFYNTLLNVESTNFLYYVENTTTGEIFSSP